VGELQSMLDSTNSALNKEMAQSLDARAKIEQAMPMPLFKPTARADACADAAHADGPRATALAKPRDFPLRLTSLAGAGELGAPAALGAAAAEGRADQPVALAARAVPARPGQQHLALAGARRNGQQHDGPPCRRPGQARPGQHRVCAGGLALCGLAVGSSAVKRVSDIWPYENS